MAKKKKNKNNTTPETAAIAENETKIEEATEIQPVQEETKIEQDETSAGHITEPAKENGEEKNGEIFVYSEIVENEGGKEFHPVTFELLYAARNLAKEFKENLKVSAIVCQNNEEDINSLKTALYQKGADKIYNIKNEKIKSHIGKARAISELCKVKNPEIFLIGATVEGRSIAPLVSSELDTGLTADCTKLEITDFKDEKKLAATRPTFGGQLMATILCKTLPQMATVRPSVLQKNEEIYKEEGEFEEFTPEMNDFCECIRLLGTEINKNKLSSELENAQIIVAGGKGLKTEENFEKLKKFAKLIGATAAGSRGAVDMGLIEKEYQIGQTGKTVSPKVYIAFGISGAIHHLVGIENSKKIIAINTDENAPIFQNADVKIVKDAAQVLDELIEEVENNT